MLGFQNAMLLPHTNGENSLSRWQLLCAPGPTSILS